MELEILALLGYFLRLLGALVFGVGAGWLVTQAFKPEQESWQLSTAAILGLLGTFALLGHWVEGGGTLGAFGLGAGAAIVLWGIVNLGKASEDGSKSGRKR